MTAREAIAEARARGDAAGITRAEGVDDPRNAPDWSPLSGEWAGESIPELLGDLMEETGAIDAEDDGLYSALCDAYEEAALEAYYDLLSDRYDARA